MYQARNHGVRPLVYGGREKMVLDAKGGPYTNSVTSGQWYEYCLGSTPSFHSFMPSYKTPIQRRMS